MNRTKALLSAGIGATAAYLFDPAMGRTRRARIADRGGAIIRRGMAKMRARARYQQGVSRGVIHQFTKPLRRPPTEVDDATLLQKVRSEAIGPWDGQASLDVAIDAGIVFLRGTAPREAVNELMRSIEGVRGVAAIVDETIAMSVP